VKHYDDTYCEDQPNDEARLPDDNDGSGGESVQSAYDRSEILWEDQKRSWALGFPNPTHKYWVQNGRIYRSKFKLYKTRKTRAKRGVKSEEYSVFSPHFARDSILLYRVQDTDVYQSWLGKLLHVGSVTVYANDKTTKDLVLQNIKRPEDFCDWLDEIVEYERFLHNVRASEFVSG
jgi:hypothetical protein